MSFKRLDSEDFLVSADSVTAALFSGNIATLTTFFSSSVQEAGASGDYYLSVYQTGSDQPTAESQFDIAFGNKNGSGSLYFNSSVPGLTPSRAIYGQYRTLVYGNELAEFVFGNATGSSFYAISLDRSRYKEKLLVGSFNLKLSGSAGTTIFLTDNSGDTSSVTFTDSGRVFQIVSGSNGKAYTGTGYTAASGSYGLFLPDIGTVLLNAQALDLSAANGGIALSTGLSANTDDNNNRKLFNVIARGKSFGLNSEETLTSDYVFIRSRNQEFNYSENPSFVSGSTGEVLYGDFIYNPQTYITTVGLYNDTNDLLAVAKLSRPLQKNFTKEFLVRVKLDF
jgi:hypothetical protein